MTKTALLELLKADKQRRFREQTGTVVKRTDGFYIRFYKDVDGVRTKVTERLCDLGTDAATLRTRQRSFMTGINNTQQIALASPTEAAPLSIGGFWSATYLPWAKTNLRYSTSRGYEKIWEQYLNDELEAKTLRTYRTIDASEFLTKLAVKLNRNSLAHVRSLMSGIFTLAVNTKGTNGKALVDQNPMRDVKVLAKVRKPKKRINYTIEEIIAILNALDRTDAKLFFALCGVLGLRPSEAAAVKWENIDFDGGVLKVREAAPYGVLGELKTEDSEGDLPIIEPVLTFIKAWHREMQQPKVGLLFTPDGKHPINHSDFAKRWIKPEAEKVCARYCGCYAGRHGAATDLYNQDGDVRAAYQVLRNSLEVVMSTYVKPKTEQGQAGLRKREQAFLKANGQATSK